MCEQREAGTQLVPYIQRWLDLPMPSPYSTLSFI